MQNVRFRVPAKYCAAAASALLLSGLASTASAQWNYGIGTGIFRMNIDGDIGLHTDIAGPVQLEVDLEPDDISDLMESAIGFGGYATNGDWMIQASAGKLELEDDPSAVLAGGATVTSEFGFDVTSAELTVGYPLYRNPSMTLRFLAGGRFTKHELSSAITVTTSSGSTQLSREIEEDWADALVGLTLGVPFAKKWSWNTVVNGGFGGSEGTYHGYTGISWRFLKHWSATVYGKYTAVEYENGDIGDADWYFYDVDEFGAGLNVMFNW